mmetsp:Transcript_76141/g.204363  ORF Transcript_76141/g.204363 Transcript_76141/m.204363 type:complete len:126 (+) Transcript_76141:735-1112(+)
MRPALQHSNVFLGAPIIILPSLQMGCPWRSNTSDCSLDTWQQVFGCSPTSFVRRIRLSCCNRCLNELFLIPLDLKQLSFDCQAESEGLFKYLMHLQQAFGFMITRYGPKAGDVIKDQNRHGSASS